MSVADTDAADAAFAMEILLRERGFHEGRVEFVVAGPQATFNVTEGPRALFGPAIGARRVAGTPSSWWWCCIAPRSMPARTSSICMLGLAERIRSIQAFSNGTPVRTYKAAFARVLICRGVGS